MKHSHAELKAGDACPQCGGTFVPDPEQDPKRLVERHSLNSPSPSQFYLTGEDRLRIVSANSVAGVALKLQVRTASLRGDIQAQSFDHTPATDRSVLSQEFPIGEGSLLNATVFVGTGSPFIGQ